MLLALYLYLCAAVLAIKFSVACFNIHNNPFAVISHLAWTNCNNLAFHRLFFGAVRNYYATLCFFLLFKTFYKNPVVKRFNLHRKLPPYNIVFIAAANICTAVSVVNGNFSTRAWRALIKRNLHTFFHQIEIATLQYALSFSVAYLEFEF